MLVKRSSVEPCEPVRIVRKMSGHPVEDDAQPGAMAGVDQHGEIGRAAEATGRGKQTGRLIAPGAVEWMLADRQELDVGKAHVTQIGRQLVGELPIAKPSIAFLRAAAPGAEMHFIDRDRCVQGIDAGCRRRRRRDRLRVDHDRGGLRAQLHGECQRIGFQRQQGPVRCQDLEFVLLPGRRARDEDFPETVAAHPHGVPPAVPEIEIADHADAPGVRRKHHEGDARYPVEYARVRADLVVKMHVGAFAEQIKVEIGQDRRKAIWVFQLHDLGAETRAHMIAVQSRAQPAREQAGLVDARKRAFMSPLVDHRNVRGSGQEDADHRIAVLAMQAEIMERVRMPSFDHCIGFGR